MCKTHDGKENSKDNKIFDSANPPSFCCLHFRIIKEQQQQERKFFVFGGFVSTNSSL